MTMGIIPILIIGLGLYLGGIILFLRFAGFVHRCDDEMKSMLDKKQSDLRISSRRGPRPRPRFRTA